MFHRLAVAIDVIGRFCFDLHQIGHQDQRLLVERIMKGVDGKGCRIRGNTRLRKHQAVPSLDANLATVLDKVRRGHHPGRIAPVAGRSTVCGDPCHLSLSRRQPDRPAQRLYRHAQTQKPRAMGGPDLFRPCHVESGCADRTSALGASAGATIILRPLNLHPVTL